MLLPGHVARVAYTVEHDSCQPTRSPRTAGANEQPVTLPALARQSARTPQLVVLLSLILPITYKRQWRLNDSIDLFISIVLFKNGIRRITFVSAGGALTGKAGSFMVHLTLIHKE